MERRYGSVNGGFRLSKEFVNWAESLSGFLTTIETRYGGIQQMLESNDWDDSKTEYATDLIRSLHQHLGKIEREMVEHVTEKYC